MILIGDVHGCRKTLHALLQKVPKGEQIWFVGDLVDRGPDSAGVIQDAIDNGWDTVIGNHELMMLKAAFSESDFELWMNSKNGGKQTLLSYKALGESWEKTFEAHLRWLHARPVAFEFKDQMLNNRKLFLSHAGLCGSGSLREAIREAGVSESLFRHRQEITDYPEIYQVIGHTPLVQPRIEKHFANIDTGAVFGRSLTAMRFPSLEVFTQNLVPEDAEQIYGRKGFAQWTK